MSSAERKDPLRILIAALGGEGGGVLMNWIVEAARTSGLSVQATSVPGVAQRTGSTTYYIEIDRKTETGNPILSLVPMPGRVYVVVSSELVETARVMSAGFVSPKLTTLISSNARQYTTDEKIALGDGRYTEENVRAAGDELAKHSLFLDLGEMATTHGTFVSATMFGALSGAGVLPWGRETCYAVMGEGRSAAASRAGFDAANAAAKGEAEVEASDDEPEASGSVGAELLDLPDAVQSIARHGLERCADYQDRAYGELYLERVRRLAKVDVGDHRKVHAIGEAARRLALWMTYEDISRVADLKSRPERFARIRAEAQMEPGQVLTVTEYLKPRAEEIADILPDAWGRRVMARVEKGKGIPLTGRGIHVRSNGVLGYRLLRIVSSLARFRRRSYRFKLEQAAIDVWLGHMETALANAPDFASALAELPRVLKGYSDTLVRGRAAYARILSAVVEPAMTSGAPAQETERLRGAIAAALADETHGALEAALDGKTAPSPLPNLKATA